jgi:methylated-DNA-protein-cysteine methyltransferase related protein
MSPRQPVGTTGPTGQNGPVTAAPPSEYVEQVLDVVDAIPPGRVMSYGMVAEVVRERTGSGSARTVGAVMARYGSAVPWHRVVAADGRLPPGHEVEAGRRLRAEGVGFRGVKVAMDGARWWPGDRG